MTNANQPDVMNDLAGMNPARVLDAYARPGDHAAASTREASGNATHLPAGASGGADPDPAKGMGSPTSQGGSQAVRTPAETMTTAADRLESILDDEIAPGPWSYDSVPEVWYVARADDEIFLEGYEDTFTEGRWIATMDPIVGRALVALLRDRAGMSRASAKSLGADNPGGLFDYELALARAILGETEV